MQASSVKAFERLLDKHLLNAYSMYDHARVFMKNRFILLTSQSKLTSISMEYQDHFHLDGNDQDLDIQGGDPTHIVLID